MTDGDEDVRPEVVQSPPSVITGPDAANCNRMNRLIVDEMIESGAGFWERGGGGGKGTMTSLAYTDSRVYRFGQDRTEAKLPTRHGFLIDIML